MTRDPTWQRNQAAMRFHLDCPDQQFAARPWLWSTVSATMYVSPGAIVSGAAGELALHGAMPSPAWDDEDGSNLLWQRYHLWKWEQAHPSYRLSGLQTIVEFGGGYGAMAIVASRLGFRGDYYITDLPEFGELQEKHLPGRDIRCNVYHGRVAKPDLFISCFGLSETPIAERDEWTKGLDPKTYLMVFQHDWHDIDNREWFISYAQFQFMRTGTLWRFEPGPPVSNAFYLTSYWGGK